MFFSSLPKLKKRQERKVDVEIGHVFSCLKRKGKERESKEGDEWYALLYLMLKKKELKKKSTTAKYCST